MHDGHKFRALCGSSRDNRLEHCSGRSHDGTCIWVKGKRGQGSYCMKQENKVHPESKTGSQKIIKRTKSKAHGVNQNWERGGRGGGAGGTASSRALPLHLPLHQLRHRCLLVCWSLPSGLHHTRFGQPQALGWTTLSRPQKESGLKRKLTVRSRKLHTWPEKKKLMMLDTQANTVMQSLISLQKWFIYLEKQWIRRVRKWLVTKYIHTKHQQLFYLPTIVWFERYTHAHTPTGKFYAQPQK